MEYVIDALPEIAGIASMLINVRVALGFAHTATSGTAIVRRDLQDPEGGLGAHTDVHAMRSIADDITQMINSDHDMYHAKSSNHVGEI